MNDALLEEAKNMLQQPYQQHAAHVEEIITKMRRDLQIGVLAEAHRQQMEELLVALLEHREFQPNPPYGATATNVRPPTYRS